MKKLIALLTAAVATLTSAWAATVTFDEGSTTKFTIINDSDNASNYAWKNCTGFSITIPEKEGLASGTKILLKSIAFVKAGSATDADNNTPTTVTIGGYKGTAVTTGTAADGWADSNIASRNTAVYSFGDGAILTVGTAAEAKISGVVHFRAAPTSNKGDTDSLISILNDGNPDNTYQPLTKLVCEVITTTEATASEDTTLESLASLTWSNGEPTAALPGIVTIPENVTLTVSASTTLPKLTFIGAGTVKYVGPETLNNNMVAPFIFGLGWTGALHLNTITLSWFDFNQFVGVDTIKVTGVAGNIGSSDGLAFKGKIILEDGENDTLAFNINDGFGANGYTFDAIEGSGTLKLTGQTSAKQQFIFKKSSAFAGAVIIDGAANKKSVLFGSTKDYLDAQEGSIIVASDVEATIASGKTWTARNGIVVKGTINAVGDLGSAAKGEGEIVYSGRIPTQANCNAAAYAADGSAWAGTVTLKNFGTFNNANHTTGAVNAALSNVERLGNANSKVKFNGVHAYLPKSNLTCAYELILEDCEEAFDGETAAWYNDNGYSGNSCTFAKLSGSGSFEDDNSACCHLITFTDVSDYTGSINAQGKRIIIGTPAEGEVVPQNNDSDKGKIHIASDATVTIAECATWAARQGIYVNGTLISSTQLTGLKTTIVGSTGVEESQDSETGLYTYTPATVVPRTEPTTVYATSQFASYVREDGTQITLIDGDTIICNDDKMGYNNWASGKDPTALGLTGHNYTLILAHEMDFGGHVGIPTDLAIKVNYRVNNTKGIYLYGDIAAGAAVTTDDDSGLLFLGHLSSTEPGNTTIGDGASIACDVGFQHSNTATINGAVTISGDIITTDGCHIILAEGATLMTAKIAEEGDAITHVSTTVEGSHVEYDGAKYVIVANTPDTIPGADLLDKNEQNGYTEWAGQNGITAETTTEGETLAIAFRLGAQKGETYETIEDAAQAEVEELVKKIDLAALAGEGGVEAALEALNAELQDKSLVAELNTVDLEGVDVDTTSLYRLVIKLIGENND